MTYSTIKNLISEKGKEGGQLMNKGATRLKSYNSSEQ